MTYKILHLVSSKTIVANVTEKDNVYICQNPYQMFPGSTVGVYIFEPLIPLTNNSSIDITKDRVVYTIDDVHESLISVYLTYHKITSQANDLIVAGMKEIDQQLESTELDVSNDDIHKAINKKLLN